MRCGKDFIFIYFFSLYFVFHVYSIVCYWCWVLLLLPSFTLTQTTALNWSIPPKTKGPWFSGMRFIWADCYFNVIRYGWVSLNIALHSISNSKRTVKGKRRNGILSNITFCAVVNGACDGLWRHTHTHTHHIHVSVLLVYTRKKRYRTEQICIWLHRNLECH